MTANYLLQSPFEKAIKDFKEGLGPRRRGDVEKFRATTFEHLESKIASVQDVQHSQRRLLNLTRLEPFLNSVKQYEKVVSPFYRNIDIVAFVWGPLKFLLQATSIFDAAFRELLDAYERMGESIEETIPLLLKCQDLFRDEPQLVLVLARIYEDVLTFQLIILRYYQQPLWRRVFSESWETCKSRISNNVRNIAQHRSLIESRATASQIEKTEERIQRSREIDDRRLDERDLQRARDVLDWLRPTNLDADQATLVETRAKYPGAGQWLLENTLFNEWFDPRFPTIPPLLWLNGIPGAGKTMLASMVVQKARELKPAPTVLYFYCKHDDPERNNFVALGRSLLSQFLSHDNELLPTFYHEFCRSGHAALHSLGLVEELLTLAFGNCKSAYIILDGLDECPRDQRKIITQWFRNLIENLPNTEPEKLRCLFVSQNDGIARKDFAGLANIKIRTNDCQQDIEKYCRVEADKLLANHPSLTKEKVDWISRRVADPGKGVFLLAKLIWTNLSGHTSTTRLEEELEPNIFPKDINDAYHRILIRILEQVPKTAEKDTLRLLSRLVCTKRSLKWHEIQAMNSINSEEVKSPKDLLASLVNTRADGSLEFVHLTAKTFLLEERHVVPLKEELALANLCIHYLSLPAFMHLPTWERVLNGDYGFLDYAVLFWLRHLEIGANISADRKEEEREKEALMADLAASLGTFIEKHWNSPTAGLSLAKRHSDKIHYFRGLPFYDRLEQAVASTKRQVNNFGSIKERETALDLSRVVCDVRKAIESIVSDALEATHRHTIEQRYGSNLFKCPQFSCQFFTTGFCSAVERDRHTGRHERPFRCPEENCLGYTYGFSSATERERHMEENHLEAEVQDEEFPTEEEVERSITNARNVASAQQALHPSGSYRDLGEESSASMRQPKSESIQPKKGPESENEAQREPRAKRHRKAEFKCPSCNAVYKKQHKLQSHLLVHES